jgi:S1-C subfamily serine protease
MLSSAAGRAGLTVAATPDAGGRSDHACFARAKIPVLHFFSGQHADYHKPGDDVHKINRSGGVRIINMTADLAEQLANAPDRPAYVEVKSTQLDPGGPQPAYRVVMGLAPGYGDDGKPGMLVEAVNAEGPADLAGMKAGDRILRIGETKVSNIYDYMASTRKNKAGDVVEVVVLRGDNEVTLSVTLAGAK